MKYKELAKIYYMNASSSRDTDIKVECEKRRMADSTFTLNFKTAQGALFIAVPRELSVLNENILRTERRISNLTKKLPSIARNAILRKMVLDEIVCTNEIEGVRSTRQQIREVLDSIDRANASASTTRSTARRFKELATLYMAIIDGTAFPPRSLEEIRGIYDKVMDGELTAETSPDGTLFRASSVTVVSTTKVVHRGLEPESRIAEALTAMMETINDEEMPALYSALASHFLFEYAHPFYDGNGRTGRYLLALYLSEPLSLATSLSLSRVIAENKGKYYKAFETAQNPLNHGELTHFVYCMLELINLAQDEIIQRLESAGAVYERLSAAMPVIADQYQLSDRESSIVCLLVQLEAFSLFPDVSLQNIAEHLGLSKQMTRRHLQAMEKAGLVQCVRRRDPMTFALTEDFKEECGLMR